MAGDQASPPQRSGLSLYANLLDSAAPGTISSAPVKYAQAVEPNAEQDEAAKKQQALAASLRFQPTKRPQLAAQKAKAKAIASKFTQQVSSTTKAQPSEAGPDAIQDSTQAQVAGPKLSAADWTATLSEDEDVQAYYASTRQKRKKRKKNKEPTEVHQDWDDIYDPSRPNSYEEYKHSEEKIREVREWKDLLYRHRMSRRRSSDYDSDASRPRPMNKQFAPPSSMSFAPPTSFDNESRIGRQEEGSDDDYVPPPPPDPSNIINDASGEDAYLRRLRLSQPGAKQASPLPPPPPPPPPVEPPAPPTGQISRAPVRYSLPPPPKDIPASEAELEAKLEADANIEEVEDDSTPQARSNRPGQAGFAERLMMKYGWTKGSGLGASGSGITNALYVKADKRKKKPDAEGGGFVTPATTGKILGGQRSKTAQEEEAGKFGVMSEVIRLENMLVGMDVQAELSRTDEEGGGLMQEIGEECGEKYGSVERVYLHTMNDGEVQVFVKFVSQLSALRAVNALEGRNFNGNKIKAKYWDKEKFDNDVYE